MSAAESGRTVTVVGGGGGGKGRRKGRGFDGGGKDDEAAERYEGRGGIYERLGGGDSETVGPQRSIEGWIVFVSNLHEEISEEDMQDNFSDFGNIKNIHLNRDRQTGYVKGYALIEYEQLEEAKAAIKTMNGKTVFGKPLVVDFAFSKKPSLRRAFTPS